MVSLRLLLWEAREWARVGHHLDDGTNNHPPIHPQSSLTRVLTFPSPDSDVYRYNAWKLKGAKTPAAIKSSEGTKKQDKFADDDVDAGGVNEAEAKQEKGADAATPVAAQ